MSQKLKLNKDEYLSYNKFDGNKSKPTVIFASGFLSDMEGTKAFSTGEFCKSKDISFIRFDYLGHGSSSGEFTDYCITDWKNNLVSIMDELTDGDIILIGSSMGGWLVLLAALERRDRVKSIIGIATAPDFTEDLVWNVIGEEAQNELKEKGIYNLPAEYCEGTYSITMKLIKDGRNNLLLKDPIQLSCPIRLIQGMEDQDVPYEYAFRIADQLISNDVHITYIKNGDHRLSSDDNLRVIFRTLEELL